jgi:cytochrome c556
MFRFSRIGYALLFLGAVDFAIGAQPATASDDSANIIKYRKQVMVANASHITAIFSVLKGETSYSGHIAAHARAIAASSAMILDIFPAGSGEGTAALPSIWQDWPKFEAATKALETAANDLVVVAGRGDMAAIRTAAGAVGKACGGCHEPFRKQHRH